MSSAEPVGTPDNAVERARALINANRAGAAIGLLHRWLATEPDDPACWLMLAIAWGVEANPAQMRAAAERAISLAPDEPLGHRLISAALADLGQPEPAAHAALQAIRLDPDDPGGHLAYAAAASRLPRFREDAYRAAWRAIELDPDDADTHFVFALTCDALNRTTECRRAYQEALRRDPGHSAARNNLAALDAGFGSRSLSTSLHAFGGVLQSDPQSVEAKENLQLVAYRGVRRFYWVAVIGCLVCTAMAGAGGGQRGARVAVGALTFAIVIGYTTVLVRQMPAGVRRYLGHQLFRVPVLALSCLLSVLMLAMAGVLAFTDLSLSQLMTPARILGFLNVGLLCYALAVQTKGRDLRSPW